MQTDGRLVFLAGATGVVGSSVIETILAGSPTLRIRAAYHQRQPLTPGNDRLEYVQGDLRSAEDCRRMVRGCDCAVLAAATTGGSAALSSRPWSQVNDNLLINAQLLEAMHQEKVRRVVYISSATTYQPFEGQIREDDLDLNQDPHPAHFGIGWVIRFTEKLCRFWHQSTGMEIVMLRASNIFGPYARFNPETSNFIPALIRKAVDRMDPFEVWGSPDVTRDVLYSEDFAQAVVAALGNAQVKFDVFNVGSGETTTVANVVDWTLSAADHRPTRVLYTQDSPTTVPYRALDCTKARQTLGWKPRYSVEEGIAKTTQWWIRNRDWWTK